MAADLSLWSSAGWDDAPDLYLLGAARSGSPEAFGELWRRHLPAAYAVANRYRGRSSVEDIVAEASACSCRAAHSEPDPVQLADARANDDPGHAYQHADAAAGDHAHPARRTHHGAPVSAPRTGREARRAASVRVRVTVQPALPLRGHAR